MELTQWLNFYNSERVHRNLDRPGHRMTPLQYLKTTRACQTGWPCTVDSRSNCNSMKDLVRG